MYRLFFIWLAFTPITAMSAEQDSSGTPPGGLSGYNEPEGAGGTEELEPSFVIAHTRSAVFASGGGGRVATVISVTNAGPVACDAAIDFYFAFNADKIPECTLNLSLAALLTPGVDTANACSRTISGDRWTLCTATCNPSLEFMQGKVVIRAQPSCAADLAIDARLYHSSTTEDIIAITGLVVDPYALP